MLGRGNDQMDCMMNLKCETSIKEKAVQLSL